jgi:hypothetical protein
MNLLSSRTAMLNTPLRVSRAYASDPLPYFQRIERAREYHMSFTDKGILVGD